MGMIFRPSSIVRDANGNPILGADGKPLKKPRTKIWWIRYYDANGKPQDESSKSDKYGDAKRLLTSRENAKNNGELVNPRAGRITFDEAGKDVIADYELNDRSTTDKAERNVRKHLAPVFGGRRLASIGTDEIKQVAADWKAEGYANAEINRRLSTLKRMFHLAVENGKLKFIPHIPMLDESGNVRKGFFEREEFEAVRNGLPAHIQPAATFFYWSGWRRDEVLLLPVRLVNLLHATVRLDADASKNDDGRQYNFGPIAELRDMFTQQLQSALRLSKQLGRVVTAVFHTPAGEYIRVKDFYSAWHSACEAAGYPTHIPHNFRRTAVRNLERAGVPRSTAKKMVGHKTDSIYERYAIVDERMHEEAAEKLAAFTSTAAQKSSKRARVRSFNRR